MDRIGGPPSVRDAILQSLIQGVGVTAKIFWFTGPGSSEERSSHEGKPRWIHCTPLLGSDEKVGVWMIGECCSIRYWMCGHMVLIDEEVMIEKEIITGSLNSRAPMSLREPPISSRSSSLKLRNSNSTSSRRTNSKLYAQYLREGRVRNSISPNSSSRHIPIVPTPTLPSDEGMLDLWQSQNMDENSRWVSLSKSRFREHIN